MLNKSTIALFATVAVFLGIVAFYAMKTGPDTASNENNNQQDDSNIQDRDNLLGWKVATAPNNQAYYNETWISSLEDDGYTFELPSGNFLNWKYTGSPCVAGVSHEPFVYGTSKVACVNSWTAWLGVKDRKAQNTAEDLAALGDFVAKNGNAN